MKSKKTIWGSVSLLVGVVVAILAFVRGPWLLPLLIAAFAVWGLWLLWTQVLPFRRTLQLRKQKVQAGNLNRALAQTLLHHVNYRLSDRLKAVYPNARWEWMMRDPALFVAQGGTGRISVYGVTDYEFADVTVDQSGKLSCSLVKLVPVQDTEGKPVPPNRQPADPKQWYEDRGRQTLEILVADLDSRGHSSLVLKEDGSVCVCPKGDGKEVRQGMLEDFPAKGHWSELVKILEQDGLAATEQDSCITVSW